MQAVEADLLSRQVPDAANGFFGQFLGFFIAQWKMLNARLNVRRANT